MVGLAPGLGKAGRIPFAHRRQGKQLRRIGGGRPFEDEPVRLSPECHGRKERVDSGEMSAGKKRPAETGEGCESFPMTAVITLADAGDGKTLYRAVALHRNMADKEAHEKMGFHEGWGTVASQLEEFARTLGVSA